MGYESEQPGYGAWVGFGGSRVTREKAIKAFVVFVVFEFQRRPNTLFSY